MKPRVLEFTDREALALLKVVRQSPDIKRNRALRRAVMKLRLAFGPDIDLIFDSKIEDPKANLNLNNGGDSSE
jgi:hypothetical protein